MLRRLADFKFKKYDGSSNALGTDMDTLAYGSANVMITGTGKNRGYQGTTQIAGPLAGAQVMMNVGEDYGGLGDKSETGIGSIFRVLGAWFFIGNGKLYRNGVYQSGSATSTLSIKKMESGALGTLYQAGLAQPSAPTIQAVTAPAGFTGANNGVVSVKIARVRAATGARSNASLASNVVTATNQSIAITFPSADSNGQDYWEIDGTKNGEGAVGNHFFIKEVPESVIAETKTANATTDADTTIGVPNGTLTSDHIGWKYTSSGDTTTYVVDVAGDDSHSAGKQQITLNAASILTTTQSATFTRAVEGVTRTYVVEWKDADLDPELAPTREYPPPAAMFGGASGDVVFVDGALGDTVDVTRYARDNNTAGVNTVTTSSLGNAIAVSDPSRPESFPPTNYIFTGDSPTCVLQGGQGMHWRFARNSLGVIRYVGGSPAVTYERIWSGIGIRNQKHAVLGAGGRLYAYTGQRGLVRLGVNGEPDTEFATPVHEQLAAMTPADVWMGYDANQQYVLVGDTTTVLAFYEPLGVWCAPLEAVPGGVIVTDNRFRSAVTYQGDCYIARGGATTDYTLYSFNTESTSSFEVVYATPWIQSDGVFDILSRIQAILRLDDSTITSCLAEIYINGNTFPTTTIIITPPTAANQIRQLTVLRPNVRSARLWQIKFRFITTAAAKVGIENIRVEGSSSEITV